MASVMMGPPTTRITDDGFAYKCMNYYGMEPPKIGIIINGAADNRSTEDTAPDNAAAPDNGHCQQHGG